MSQCTTLPVALTYQGARRRITAELTATHLQFSLGDTEIVTALPLMELWWQSVWPGLSARKHPLQPRLLKGKTIRRRVGHTVAWIAKRYGVSDSLARQWKGMGAPVEDPDAMGDYIYAAKQRTAA